jgi:hypothetical protein
VPWEVGFTGGFARDNMINHREVHVSPDVALFVKQYLLRRQHCSNFSIDTHRLH